MSGQNIRLGITLTADNAGLVGTVKASGAEVDKYTNSVRQSGEAAKKAGAESTAGFAASGQAAGAMAQQVAGATQQQQAYVLSAKEMRSALRQVPQQFTDIATSLAAGQKPLQVLLQQGGQLKDMFGGAAPAARALGSYVLGLVNPFTVAGAAVVGLALAYESGRRESAAMANAIILTGNAAGATVGQMQGYARTVAAATGATRGLAADALTQLVATGKVSQDMLGRATEAAIRLQRAGGPAIDDTVARFAELGKSPLDASLKLNDSTNYLTSSVYRQIKALQEQNDMAGAGALAQGAYADAIKERTPEMEKNLGLVERAWRGVAGAAKKAWDAVLDVGRESTGAEKITELEAKLNDLTRDQQYHLRRGDTYAAAGVDIEIRGVQGKLDRERDLEDGRKLDAQVKANAKDRFALEKAAQDEADKSATKQIARLEAARKLLAIAPEDTEEQRADKAQRELELTRQIRDLEHARNKEERDLFNARLDGAQKLVDVWAKGDAAHLAALRQMGQASAVQALNAQADSEYRQLQLRYAVVESSKIGPTPADKQKQEDELEAIKVQMLAAQQDRLDKFDQMEDKAGREAIARDAAIAKERGQLERAFTLDFIAKNQLAMREAYAAGDAELIAQLQAQFDAGLGNAQFSAVKQEYDLLFEQLKNRLADVRQEAERDGGWLGRAEAEATVRTITSQVMPQLVALGDKLTELGATSPINAKTAAAAKGELKKLVTDVDPIWKDLVKGVDRTFHDGFARMLESGKTSWAAFTESLKNTFKTTVADAIYQFFARPFVFRAVGSVAGAMGFSGAANAFGAAGNPLSLASSANNLVGGATAAYNTGAYVTLGGMGAEQAAMLAAQDAVFGTAGTAATLEAAGAGAFASSIGAALPWIGGALAVGSMTGVFDGAGDAMRTGRYVAPFAYSNGAGDATQGNMPDGSRYNYLNNAWFSADMAPAQDAFDAQLQADELAIAQKLGLQARDWAAINQSLAALEGRRYNFGMEHTDVASSGAFEQIRADRMQAIADGLGMSLRDLTDIMSGAKKSAYELARETQKLSAEQAKAKASELTAAMGTTLSALDSVTGLRASLLSSVAGIRGGNSYAQRMGGLQDLLSGATDVSRQVQLAGEMRDLVLERYRTERAAIEDNRKAALASQEALRASLRAVGQFAAGLLVGDVSPLTAGQQLEASRSQFGDLLARARTGDAEALSGLSGAATTYLGQARGYYASSDAYTSIFSGVQSTLAAMGVSADAVMDTTDWQARLLAVDTDAVTALDSLTAVTEDWTLNLENLLIDQTRQFERLGIKLTDISDNTRGLDARVATLIDTALASRFDKLATAVNTSAQATARAVTNAVQVAIRA